MNIDWDNMALHSELTYSEALGGEIRDFNNFIHIYNRSVPYGGDFNRAAGIKLNNCGDFASIERAVRAIHKEYNLNRPDRYDIYPPVLNRDIWSDYLASRGYYLCDVIFYQSKITDKKTSYPLYVPSPDEYLDWFTAEQKGKDYYDAGWFEIIKPLQMNFIKIFKPYWLIEEHIIKGRVYGANSGEYFREIRLQ